MKQIMKRKEFILILPIVLIMLLLLGVLISLVPNDNIAYANSSDISPYIIERGALYYNSYCDTDNGFIPKTPIELVYDVNGRIINDASHINLDVQFYYNNATTAYCYAKPEDHLRYTTYTRAYSNITNYVNRVDLFGKDYKFRFYTNYRDEIVDDSYKGNIAGVKNVTTRLGKGAVFYRIKYAENNGWSEWTEKLNIFGNSSEYYLPITINSDCDIEIVNVYEILSVKDGIKYYYNLRQDFVFKCRKKTYNSFAIENGTGSTLVQSPDSTASTKSGFFINPTSGTTYRIKKDDGAYQNYSSSALVNKTFTDNGVYEINYLDPSAKLYEKQVITVDNRDIDVKINGQLCEKYKNAIRIDGEDYLCFNSTNPLSITWSKYTNGVPIVVSRIQNNQSASIKSGDKLNPGTYKIQAVKKYSLTNVIKTYNVFIGDIQPIYNYELLRNGESYTNRPNRFSTRYYGVKLNNVNYGYATQQAALEKGLEYERSNFVTQNGSNYQYRGKTYTNNEALTSAMNAYVKANYFFENRDLKSGAQTVLQSELKDNRVYLNGFKFEYNSNPVYSNSVRVLKATDKYPNLDADVKSILRDTSNKSVVNIMYEKTVDSQLSAGGKYYIRETNVFGNEYFYEAYYVANNETSASISYYDTNGILKNGSITSGSANISGVTSLHISKITNELDQYATIKITKDGKTVKILVVGDEYTLTEAGTYTLLFIDRNGKEFTKSVTITNPNFVLNGVKNTGTANNDVTISLKGGYEIEMFVVGGEIISGEVFKLNSKTQRYEYTVQQDTTEKDVVLILKYGNDTINIGFSMTAKI